MKCADFARRLFQVLPTASHRRPRRRRPAFECYFKQLDQRLLLASSSVLFQDTFSSSTPSSAWSFVGGTWQINKGTLSQTSTAAADPKKAMITNQTLPQQPHDHGRGPGQFLERGGHGPRRRRPLHQPEQRPWLQPRLSRSQPGSIPGRQTHLGQRLHVPLAGGHLVLVPARGEQRDLGGQGVGGRDRRTAELDVPADGMDRPDGSAGAQRGFGQHEMPAVPLSPSPRSR